MKFSFLRVCGRSTFLMIEILAVTVGLLVLLAGGFMWRLTTGPLDLGFARDYVEDALKESDTGYSADIEGAFLSWPQISGPLVLTLRQVDLLRHGNSFLKVAEMDMGIAVRPMFFGHIRPVTLNLKEPSVRMYRSTDNTFQLSLNDEEPENHLDQEKTNVLETVIEALSRNDQDRRKWGPLALLRQFQITHARLVVEDHILGVTWYISPFDLSLVRDREGLVISSTLQLPGGANRSSVIVADAIYNPGMSDLVLNIHLQDIDPHALAQKVEALSWFRDQSIVLNGDLTLITDPRFQVRRVGMNLTTQKGFLSIPEAYEEPVLYDEVSIKADYDHEKGTLALDNLTLKAQGIELIASTQASITKDKVVAPLKLEVPTLPVETLGHLWPAALNDTSARSWFQERLTKGRFYDGVVNLNIEANRVAGEAGSESRWDVSATGLTADAKIENMDVNYNRPMLPVSNAHGVGRVEHDTLTIDIAGGQIDELSVDKATVKITELTSDNPGEAFINADLGGPVKSVIKYVQQEPIHFDAEKAGIRVDQVKGQASLNVDVSFPTLRDLPVEKVMVKAKAKAQDVLLPGLINGLDVSGNGIDVAVDKGEITIKGPAKLQGRDTKVDFHAFFNSDGKPYVFQAKAGILADYELRKVFGAGLEDWLAGDPFVNVVYTERQGGKADVQVDGAVDNVKLLVKPFEYEKPEGIAGTASATVLLDKGRLTEIASLTVTTPDLKVENGRLLFDSAPGQAILRRGQIARARLAETDVALDFEQVPNGPMKLKATGAFFDARPFMGKGGEDDAPYAGPAIIASADVARMRTHPARLIEKAKVYLDMGKTGEINQFELDAVAGTGPLYLRLKPDQSGKLAVHLEAQDAGSVLRAFDIYENVEGGQMKIYGEQVIERNTRRRLLRGSGEITNFKVVKAPALAQLVGALSVTGIRELLSGQGIAFSQLQADFDWVIRRHGDVYYMRNGRTSGSSIGLTFEGKIDKKEDVMDVGGTVVPVTFVNDFISNIPLIGTLLTGGEGALIAATYSVKGPVKTPTVTVNPLSALTPGILRRIFFEEQKADRAPDSMGPPAPKRQPSRRDQPAQPQGVNR
jgi:hypothetical protein